MRSVRDLVLVVGLAGVVVGGVALMFKTSRSSGSHLPAVLAVLVLLLGAGAALTRWGRAPTRRRTGALGAGVGANAGDGTVGTARLPDADGCVEEGALDTVTAPPGTAPVVAEPATPPAVGSGALDHVAVDPEGFEHTIAALCARDGCSPVEVVGGAGDLGADVIATTADGRRVVLQCKQYGEGHRVGSPDLQRFGGTCYAVHEADVAVLVTTSSFTEPALEYAASCGIVCVDGTELAAWTASAVPAPWVAGVGEPVPGTRDGTILDS
ncbi:restriction endonuclease [Streptomyces sp. NPDC006197]|uniref:restriction endonuclease n=1 Tax=Streptomyces sp. NPDC006197 TaxID=3156685 RepID=UPI0033B5BA09